MIPVDFIVQPQIDPILSLATDRQLRRAVARRSRSRAAVLRVYDMVGDTVSIGRYHFAPSATPAGPVRIWRRHTGGRTVASGDGFVGLSLILPHRSALLSDRPFALAPYQVLNRYVRGLMEACRGAGLRVYYPGRDFVTIDGRVVAVVSFETDEHGTLLFEAIIARSRDFSVLPDLLESVDQEGAVKAEILAPNDTTCLAAELERELSFDEAAEMLRQGYAQQFGLELHPVELNPLECRAIDAVAAHELGDEQWLRNRSRSAELDRHASMWTQLGVFEASFALRQERFLKEIVFAGDFIANSPGVAALERDLRLCPLEWSVIDSTVKEVFARPENYLLGLGKLRVIADLLTRGGGS